MATTRYSRPTGGVNIWTAPNATAFTAAETLQISTGHSKVSHVVVWDAGNSATVTIYDHASGNSNQMWSWATADGKGTFVLQLPIEAGIRVVTTTGGTLGVTVVWE